MGEREEGKEGERKNKLSRSCDTKNAIDFHIWFCTQILKGRKGRKGKERKGRVWNPVGNGGEKKQRK